MGSKRLLTALVSVLLTSFRCASVLAETCKYVDRDGHVTYSNASIPNARKVGCIEAPPPVSGPAATDPTKPIQATPQAGSKSPDGSQPRTSDDRRKALMEELAREQDALAKAREALAQQEAIRLGDERNYARVLERLKPYQDEVAAHEKKITELRQELASLR
jgi:hypothetical protein